MCNIEKHPNVYWELTARACVCPPDSLWEEAEEKKMNINQASGFDKYIIMCDKGQNKLASDYQSYLKFKEVQNALVKISQTPGKTYVFNGVTHEKGMTCAQADRVLDNIFNCKTNMEMISLIVKVARQIGFHEITLPRKIRWGM